MVALRNARESHLASWAGALHAENGLQKNQQAIDAATGDAASTGDPKCLKRSQLLFEIGSNDVQSRSRF